MSEERHLRSDLLFVVVVVVVVVVSGVVVISLSHQDVVNNFSTLFALSSDGVTFLHKNLLKFDLENGSKREFL